MSGERTPFQCFSNEQAGFWRFYNDTKIYSCQTINDANLLIQRLLNWTSTSKAVIFTDKNIESLAWFKSLNCNLSLPVASFIGTPDVATLDAVTEKLVEHHCDHIIAIGGGTVLDAAKLLGSTIAAHISTRAIPDHVLSVPATPVTAIPTTFGTGSETNMISHIHSGHNKNSIRRSWLMPTAAVLVTEIATQVPSKLRLLSCIDAWSHIIEGATLNFERSPIQEALLSQALKLMLRSIPGYLKHPDLNNAQDIATASTLAGLGLNNARTALPHALATPFAAHTGLSHAESLLPFLGTVSSKLHPYAAKLLSASEPASIKLDTIVNNEFLPRINHITQAWGFSLTEADLQNFVTACMQDTVTTKESPIEATPAQCMHYYRSALSNWLRD